jgi:dihydroorotase-like cyclic amidohydrolase
MALWTAAAGIPGVETMLPVMVSEGYNKGRIGLSRLVEILCTSPAIHYGLYPKKGVLAVGSDADFAIVDLEREWIVDENKIQCLNKYTPLHGMKLKGKVVRTIVRGEDVFTEEKGIVANPGFGKYVKRQTIGSLQRKLIF